MKPAKKTSSEASQLELDALWSMLDLTPVPPRKEKDEDEPDSSGEDTDSSADAG